MILNLSKIESFSGKLIYKNIIKLLTAVTLTTSIISEIWIVTPKEALPFRKTF